MKMIKNIIEYLIAISVIPAIVLTVVSVTELKDVRNVQFELLSEEDGIFNVTQGTFDKLRENRRIKNYEIESNYPLITKEEMERATWFINDLKNEIYIDENGQKRIRENVGRLVFDGSENWYYHSTNQELKPDVLTFFLTNVTNLSLYSDYNNLISNYFTFNYEVWNKNEVGISSHPLYNNIYINISKSELKNYSDDLSDVAKRNLFKQWLQDRATEGNPLIVWFELAVKNPGIKIIEEGDIRSYYTDFNHIDVVDFNLFPDQKIITGERNTLHKNFIFENAKEVTYEQATDPNFIPDDNFNWYIRPSDGGFSLVVPKGFLRNTAEARNYFNGKSVTYELAQPRPVEVYDFSKFRLVYDKNRIRVTFDIDDGYYLWEITKDDKMIPINGQYDLGNIWTVKFYVYEIQQPIIRTLVLLIPLIVISGVLIYMYNTLKKKDLL